ncbi:hypothetical protein O1611_g7250 [Lasiodiplodia mahajangana]|uniref:Uncharacterized protein n=1 Tax=Lasiodiplodia mahajangana TaxID=1108764 RepID=A0ACC2JGD4_9PEZI|nr:hypothetical protein O1611_g7250 [Lasiodiplodia mahajangana]
MMLRSVVTGALLLAASANAHFTVQYPTTVGTFDEDKEDQSPCGGYSPDIDTITAVDFHVGGDSIATMSTHPQTTWLYRITTDAISKDNWTQIYEIVLQSGPGNYCTKTLTIPSDYVGQKAILSIVGSGADGVLYQCAAVQFVNGTASTPSSCVNGTNVVASFMSDSTLSSMVSSSLVGNGSSSSGSSTTSPTSSASPTETDNAASSLHGFTTEGFGPLLITSAMMLAGFAFMV